MGSMKVGFLGTGHLAAPMARALAGKGHSVVVSRRNEAVSAGLARDHGAIGVAENQEVIDRSDVVFLSLRAEVARAVLPNLKFRSGQTVISVMAGVTLAELAEFCAPAVRINLTIPLPFIESGGCPLPVFPASPELEALFGGENQVLTVPSEAALTLFFAATAMLATTLALLERTSEWLGEGIGDKRIAEIYIAKLLSGIMRDLPTDGADRFAEGIRGLATKGGLNEQVLNHMRDAGAMTALGEALDGIEVRLNGV